MIGGILLFAGTLQAAPPPESIEDNISLLNEATSRQVAIDRDIREIISKIRVLRGECRSKRTTSFVEHKTYEETLLKCSREFRGFKANVDGLNLRVLKERLSLQSGLFANFPDYIQKATSVLNHFDSDLEVVKEGMDQIADLFIDEYGKVREQEIQSVLAKAKLAGTYEGLCKSFRLLSDADKERIPLFLDRAKDFGDVFLLMEKINGMLKLGRTFQGRCNLKQDLSVYRDLQMTAETTLKKYDSKKWVNRRCQILRKKRDESDRCPKDFTINSYLVTFLKSVKLNER